MVSNKIPHESHTLVPVHGDPPKYTKWQCIVYIPQVHIPIEIIQT